MSEERPPFAAGNGRAGAHITMADVAREAGCSLNTVSRALNGKPDISEETRRRVLEVVERLGYIPHATARSLAAGRSSTIGLIIANATVPIYSTIISAVEETCERHGFTLLLGHSREDVAREERALRVLREHMVAGLIMAPVQTSYEHLRELKERGPAVVLVVRDIEALEMDYVGIDNAGGAALATRHLLDLGHRRIGYVGAQPVGSTARDRLAGYSAALEERGLRREAALEALTLADLTDVVGAYQATRTLFAAHAPSPPTALYLYSSQLAPGVYRALREAGRRVPDDVAVIGQGEFGLAPYLDVPLTHVHHPVWQMGERAAELLLRRVRGGRSPHPEKMVLTGQLVVMGSCGSTAAEVAGAEARATPAASRG